MPRIREQYIESGQVRFVYKHFAILGTESNRSAEASECAADQDKFWDYHDALFADQMTNRSAFNDDWLIDVAEDLGMDATVFGQCLISGRYATQVKQQALSTQSMGLRGTPAFLVNGTVVSGAQPFSVFQQLIEEQLGNRSATTQSPPPQEEVETSPSPIQEPISAEDGIGGVILFPEVSIDHEEEGIEYPQPVPPGGEHSAAWQNCGIYEQPIGTESAVHSLEHGAVWITYQPDLAADQIEILRELVRQEEQKRGEPLVLLSPLPEQVPMEAPVVVTAWRVQLQLDQANDERLLQFLDLYQNGPYAPEPGASCLGGVGEPLN